MLKKVDSFSMKNDWEIFEKLTSVFQFLFGIVILYATYWRVFYDFDSGLNEYVFSKGKVDYYEFITDEYFSLVLGIVGIVGGINWFFYKTNGWLLTLLFWFSLGFSTSVVFYKFITYSSHNITSNPEFWIYSLTIFITILLLVFLTVEFFWKKYKPTKIQLITLGTIVLMVLIDRLVLNK